MMTSSPGAHITTGPLYFFDQPTRRSRIKARRSILYLANEGDAQSQESGGKTDELGQRLSGETCRDGEPDTGALHHPLLGAYRRAAPRLLSELARLLALHKWTEVGCIPRGIVNVLNYSWRDLTAGATVRLSSSPDHGHGESKGSLQQLDEAAEGESWPVGNVDREPEFSWNPRLQKRKQNDIRAAHNSTGVTFSISSSNCKHPGWIILPKRPSCDDSQWITLCQRVVERLKAARDPEKLQTDESDLNKTLILRHYGDAKAEVMDRRVRRKSQLPSPVNLMPQMPEMRRQDPARQKLHYRINDGTSFIYYPSGRVAVCQSRSGLPCGGFYTNVFGDSERPVVLATVTAFGHGAVTHPLSSAITAVWDQDGGFTCDHHGNITKEWSWQTRRTLKRKIVVQLSDLISVKLLSGTSAVLSFRCNKESVQLPLFALPDINQSKETAGGKLTSDAAEDLPVGETKSPAVVVESKMLTPMAREVEGPGGLSARLRRGGHAGRELRRLQQRVRNTLDDWLDFYRAAIGIKCPDMERMPDAPLRTRPRREVQSAALPSLNPPERADAKAVRPEETRKTLQELRGHLSTPKQRPLESCITVPRTSKKQTKEGPRVSQIGPLQIHGNIEPESVIIPNSPDLQPSAINRLSAPPLSCAPVTACPALLRAALRGEGGGRRCCCSAALMPAVTDLEYDAFVTGQPPHSQQILVVCVTLPQQHVNAHVAPGQDVLERLYRRRNRHRTMPCTQGQMDSFRLLRYEMSAGKPSCGAVENILLQQRHSAAPGMVLMYIRGKLLFVGYISSGHSRSVRDLQKQISRSRGDYRLGLSLPSDYKFSDTVNAPAATDAHVSQDTNLKGEDDITRPGSVEKAKERKTSQICPSSHQRQRDFCGKPKRTAALPVVPVISH